MSKLALILLILTSGAASATELSVPKSFVNGEVADAEDFNSNNKYLVEKISEEKAKIDDLLANARWKNAGLNGAAVKTIDCSSNQAALIEAYHANTHEDHLIFLLTGSCFGAYRWVEEINDDGTTAISQTQPKNQVVGIMSDTTVDASNRAKIVPRTLVADREYFVAGLVSSFGNGLYITGIDIEMGADDQWGVLYSRSSNGDLTDVAIKGAAEPTGAHRGVLIQNGAAAYIGGTGGNAVIEGVDQGIALRGEAMANIYGNLKINANTGIDAFNGGTFQTSLSGDGKITASTAININQGGQAFINNGNTSVSIDGSISVSSGSISIYGSTVLSTATTINVNSSTLNIWNDNSGITADRVSCSGPSIAGIAGLSMTNNNGNGCLDQAAWKTLIDAAFPSSGGGGSDGPSDRDVGGSRMPESGILKQGSNSGRMAVPSAPQVGGFERIADTQLDTAFDL
jgi:hypothetical protein